eukprot:6009188-Lingulodinium_polyedra.AAC.1
MVRLRSLARTRGFGAERSPLLRARVLAAMARARGAVASRKAKAAGAADRKVSCSMESADARA